jgi:hypothetical protein
MLEKLFDKLGLALKPALAVLWIGSLLPSCGSTESFLDDSDDEEPALTDDSTTSSSPISAQAQRRTPQGMFRIPVALTLPIASETAFALSVPVTAYSISLTDCSSGHTATITQANVDGLEVYRDDRDCLVKLTQFTQGGKVYFPTSYDPFTTWQAGDTAIFDEAGEPGVQPYTLVMTSTIESPILGTELIQIGTDEVIKANTKGTILAVTLGAINSKLYTGGVVATMDLRSVTLTGLTAAGAGKFILVLECTTSIGATNTCGTVPFSATDYILTQDTAGNAPTRAECEAYFAGGSTVITLPNDRVAPGASGTVNGGFITVEMTGPAPMNTKPNMQFLIRTLVGTKYAWKNFNIDVKTAPTY